MTQKNTRTTRVLSSRYELGRRLGAGGMAEVHLGRDRVLGRTIAVKMLLAQFSGDPQFIARFRREAQSAAALNHPHIVGVYDTGSDDGTHFIVMEYVEGRTLRDAIREEGPLLAERAAEIAADVCSALSFAHAHGIIHRDVKPANIMLTKSGGVKVTDFGIARAVSGDTVTQTATVLGTAQYFSPEQAQGGAVDARSDVYSLGIVLYEMLTRQVPFTGSSPVAIAYKHVKEDPIAPSRLNPDIPPGLEAIVMKALAKNPANRYQSADEMREDLLRSVQGRPVSATPVLQDVTAVVSPLGEETLVITRRPGAAAARVSDPVRKRRAVGFALLALIVVGIVGVGVWAAAGVLNRPKMLAVRDVINRRVSEAQTSLEEQGFKVSVVDPVPNDQIPEGFVARQDPEAGSSLQQGKTVLLTPSAGPKEIAVLDVRGKTEQDARVLLEKSGLKVGEITRQPDDRVARGVVIAQNPKPGVTLRAGQTVDLTISSGKPTALVPDVTCRSQDDATALIEGRNLKIQVIPDSSGYFGVCSDPPGSGRAWKQDPVPDKEVEQGSTVQVWVASDVMPTETPTPTPTPTA